MVFCGLSFNVRYNFWFQWPYSPGKFNFRAQWQRYEYKSNQYE